MAFSQASTTSSACPRAQLLGAHPYEPSASHVRSIAHFAAPCLPKAHQQWTFHTHSDHLTLRKVPVDANEGLERRAGTLRLALTRSSKTFKSNRRADIGPPSAMLATEQPVSGEEHLVESVGATREAEEERRLRSSEGGAIAGIPRHEWVR